LSLPVGLCLYGLNVARRGDRIVGYALTGLSIALVIGTPFSNQPELDGFNLMLPGVFVGIGLLNLENRPYRAALSRGGLTANWWAPLLWVAGLIIAWIVLALRP
jgi:predicted branched-subunit amino acid permease